MQQQEQQIIQTCIKINNMLQLQVQDFQLEYLQHSQWYIEVISIIYPQLQEKLQQIIQYEDQAHAIDQLLVILSQQDIIEEDFLEIKGENIINGDIQSIYYVVQLINALIQRQAETQEDNQQQQNEQGQQQQEYDNDNDFQEEQNSNISPNTQQNQNDHLKKYPDQMKNIDQNVNRNNIQNHIQSVQSQINDKFEENDNSEEEDQNKFSQSKQERHSVLGIAHEFQDSNDEDQAEQQQEQVEIVKKNTQQQIQQKVNNVQNYHSNNTNIKKTNQLVETGYKTSQKQKINSKQNKNNQYNPFSNNTLNNQNKKPFFPTQSQNQSQKQMNNNKNKKQNINEQSASQDQNQYFTTNLQPKGLKKYKSNEKVKVMTSGSKKSTTKKIPKHSNNVYINSNGSKKPQKHLITHPTIKKVYRKATNPQAKQLTFQVKDNLNKILKKKKQMKTKNTAIKNKIASEKRTNVTENQLERKRRQVKIKVNDWQKDNFIRKQKKQQAKHLQQYKSENELGKVLNWRQGQLKKQKKQFEQAMQMKLQVQKQNYVKKINKLILKLEKEKQLQQRKDYKQKMLKENYQAAKRLTAIEKWYKDRLNMLKDSREVNRSERNLLHTGHKEILKTIEKQLKRQNQKQIMAMTMKFRKNQAEIQNDLEQLQKEIIKVYKRN